MLSREFFPTITRALDKLQEKGLIFRQPLDLDGRELQIHATRAGVAIKAPLNDAAAKVSARLKKLIGHADFADTVDRVVAVRNALK